MRLETALFLTMAITDEILFVANDLKAQAVKLATSSILYHSQRSE
jgi:hypothetical protein